MSRRLEASESRRIFGLQALLQPATAACVIKGRTRPDQVGYNVQVLACLHCYQHYYYQSHHYYQYYYQYFIFHTIYMALLFAALVMIHAWLLVTNHRLP